MESYRVAVEREFLKTMLIIDMVVILFLVARPSPFVKKLLTPHLNSTILRASVKSFAWMR